VVVTRAISQDALRQAEELRELVLRELVLRYLAEHPGAMDTLEGIAEWWITREQLRVDLERLSRVLDELTRQGIVEETALGDARVYRLRSAVDRGGEP
jgi:Fe2+ or Zn2+ uptake regulation protein